MAVQVTPPSNLDLAEQTSAQLREQTLPPDHKLGIVQRVLIAKGFGFIKPKLEYGAGVVVDEDDGAEADGGGEAADGNEPPAPKRAKTTPSGASATDSKDIFFLLVQVAGDKPHDGDLVSYRVTSGRQGLMAVDVTVIRAVSSYPLSSFNIGVN